MKALDRYVASGNPDVDQVSGWWRFSGPRRNVEISTSDGEHLRARIDAIGQYGMSMSKGDRVMQVPYSTIDRIKPAGMRVWAKAAIIAGVAAGAVILGAFLSLLSNLEQS